MTNLECNHSPLLVEEDWYRLEQQANAIIASGFVRAYYTRSPRGNIIKYRDGFIVHCHRTGWDHPCKTWEEARSLFLGKSK